MRKEESYMISLDEAKKLMTKEKSEKLRQVVCDSTPTINFSNKLHNDIIMSALCDAVSDDVIHVSDLDDKLIKLLNSNTNTISFPKLINALHTIHETNPSIVCHIKLTKPDPAFPETINYWTIDGKNGLSFHDIFEYVVKKFEITPREIRVKMTKTLKPTVVNNVAQLVAKYFTSTKEEQQKMVISIKTISRLVNMIGMQLSAEFRKDV